jgi:hypothetical protein
MPRRPPVEITTGLRAHPAVTAWSELQKDWVEPECIHILRESEPSSIYRLFAAGPAGSDVIAKRCQSATALIERTIYEEVLPNLPVTAPRYYGCAQTDGLAYWLFIEDVGGERYQLLNPEHCALAGRWLGLMHGSATSVAAAARLPDGGPGRYLKQLRSGRDKIQRNLFNPALTLRDIAVLEEIVALDDLLELQWGQVEKCCEGMPMTLVHGDFRPKNAYLRNGPPGLHLFPIDWETAGWGVPSADLTRVDIAAYWSVVREWWPNLVMQSIERLANVGQVFRSLAAIDWESVSLAFDTDEWLREPMACMRVYQARLSDAIQTAKVMQG